VNGLPTVRVIRGILLSSALSAFAAPLHAAGPVGAVAPPHGPIFMIYITQPLGSRSASRVFGLRLSELAQPNPLSSASMQYGPVSQRPLVDLQIRRQADVRVEFGQRLTWDLRRGEFALSGVGQPRAVEFAAHPGR
jgi:hypothetical protein